MPPLQPAPKATKPDALAIFTDRVEEQKMLRKILAHAPTKNLGASALLTQFYGVGGVGKSTLCQRACEIAAAEFKDTVRVVTTSFDDSRWKEGSAFTEVSAELCRCLAGQKIVPRLTLTLLLLHGQQTGRNGEVVDGLDAGWAMAFKAMEKGVDLTGIPGLAMVFKGAQWVRERSQRQALRQRLTDLGLWPEEQYGKLNILDLEKKLSSALYYDLLDWLKENPGQHVRLLLDGFERLQSSERREDSQRRLQEFIGYFAGPDERDACDRFRVVIFGRNQLRWDEIYEDPNWRDYWNLHLLGGLAEADARDFLKKTRTWLASKGQSALAEALIKYEDKILDASDETKGGQRIFYPFYLNLAVELVERARQSGRELEMGRAPAELQDRFFRYLESKELRALMILALSELFDESLFDWLAKERLIEYPQHSFHSQLRREHSYLQAVNGREGEWRFHRLMEDALHARWQSTAELKCEGVNLIKRLLDHYGAPLLAKPERDWADPEVELWRRGMEIIVTQGPELGLLKIEEWNTLLETKPWYFDHHRCVAHRVEFQRRILHKNEQLLGPEHPDTLNSIQQLAVLLYTRVYYWGEDSAAEAGSLIRRVMKARERILGPEHPDTLYPMHFVAVLHLDGRDGKKDLPKAEMLIRRVLEAQERILGPEHPNTLASINTLSRILIQKGENFKYHGDYEGLSTREEIANKGILVLAEMLIRRALKAQERILGPEDPHTLASVEVLASLLEIKGDFSQTEMLIRQKLEAQERILGREHPDTLLTLKYLAELLADNGDFAQGESLYRRALEGQKRIFGPEHTLTKFFVRDYRSLHRCGRSKPAQTRNNSMHEQLKLLHELSNKIATINEQFAEGFGSELVEIANEARHPHWHGEVGAVGARGLVIDCIQRSLAWWREVGNDRHYSQRCTAQVEECFQAANGAAGANVALKEAFDALVTFLSRTFDLSDNERGFLAEHIKSMGNDIHHRNRHGDNESIDLLVLWNQFGSTSYSDFVLHLLTWTYDNDDYQKVSYVCGCLFGHFPETDSVKKILLKGIWDVQKSNRIRERFFWCFNHHFKDSAIHFFISDLSRYIQENGQNEELMADIINSIHWNMKESKELEQVIKVIISYIGDHTNVSDKIHSDVTKQLLGYT